MKLLRTLAAAAALATAPSLLAQVAVVVLWVVATLATIAVAPDVFAAWKARPLAWGLTAAFVIGLAATAALRRRQRDLAAFLGSVVFIAGALSATAVCVFPAMLRDAAGAATLTAFNASASESALRAALWWWPVGAALATAYFVMLFRIHRGKAQAPTSGGY